MKKIHKKIFLILLVSFGFQFVFYIHFGLKNNVHFTKDHVVNDDRYQVLNIVESDTWTFNTNVSQYSSVVSNFNPQRQNQSGSVIKVEEEGEIWIESLVVYGPSEATRKEREAYVEQNFKCLLLFVDDSRYKKRYLMLFSLLCDYFTFFYSQK